VEIREVVSVNTLNQTSIDLGEYVINPYKGCFYACLYCYARFSKSVRKDEREWGEYIDVRVNTPELLEKEIRSKSPRKVLLGSTTECFQPYELNAGVTGKVLDILNAQGVKYSILTRSPLILNYLDKLSEGCCESVYFTVNDFDDTLKELLEARSPSFRERAEAINLLLARGITVIPYFSPILPFIFDAGKAFSLFPEARRIEFEGLNFNLGNIRKVVDAVIKIYPGLDAGYSAMYEDMQYYENVWNDISTAIRKEAIIHRKDHRIHMHRFQGYFVNKYEV